ncbi:hypothetical protein CR513_24202, partial [Mucuna pruriens]
MKDEEEGPDEKALVELERLLEQEGPKLQYGAKELEIINLGEEGETREIKASSTVKGIRQCLRLVISRHAGYKHIQMAQEDREKTTFVTTWGTFCYKVMPFGLKNARMTYQRAMMALFHEMMHKEVEVYMDDMIAKSKTLD